MIEVRGNDEQRDLSEKNNEKRRIYIWGGEDEIPGQMNIYDYDEWLSEEMKNGIRNGIYQGSRGIFDGQGD